MRALVDAKRRIYQTAVEKLGHGERMAKDEEEFKQALDSFRRLETEYRQLHDHIHAQHAALVKLSERNLSAANAFAVFFSSPSSSEDEDGHSRLSQSLLQAAMRCEDQVVQASAARVIEVRCLFPLDRVLKEQIPAIKKRIIDHKNFETDVSSYHRRLKTLTEGKKTPLADTDPELVKQREKYEQADERYTQHHTLLLTELHALARARTSFVQPIFLAFAVAVGEAMRLGSDEWNAPLGNNSTTSSLLSQLDQMQAREIKQEIKMLMDAAASAPVVPMEECGSRSAGAGGSRLGAVSLRRLVKPPPPAVPSTPSSPASPPASVPSSRLPPPVPSSLLRSSTTPSTTPPPPPGLSSRAAFAPGCVCVAHTAYQGPDEGDLSLQVGDRVVMREELNPGWWLGHREGGDPDADAGLFPDTYVYPVVV